VHTADDTQTYWVATGEDSEPSLTLTFAQPQHIGLIDIREYLPLGQRIDGWAIDIQIGTEWHEVAVGASIGNRRLVQLSAVQAHGVRLRVTGLPVPPALRTMRVYGA
jgi:alpha-L-fucosidase